VPCNPFDVEGLSQRIEQHSGSKWTPAARRWPPWPGTSAATTCTNGWPGSSRASHPAAQPREHGLGTSTNSKVRKATWVTGTGDARHGAPAAVARAAAARSRTAEASQASASPHAPPARSAPAAGANTVSRHRIDAIPLPGRCSADARTVGDSGRCRIVRTM
jgi:hypothetical protein